MSTTAARISVPGIAFLAAGGAVLLAIVAFVTDLLPNTLTLYVIAYAGVAVGLGALTITDLRPLPARVTAGIAAILWAVLAVTTALGPVPALIPALTLAATLATAAAVLITRSLPRAAIPLLVFSLAAGLYLLSAIAAFYGNLAALSAILFGATTALLGYFLVNRR